MYKTLIAVGAIAATVLTGCKNTPTPEVMYKTANAIGVSAGMVANASNIPDDTRTVVVDIVKEVDKCIPRTNQTFEAAWTPVAEAHVEKLVADGKLTNYNKDLVLKTFNIAVCGIDYIFDVRYPEARQYQDVVESAVHGFTEGFLVVFKSTTTLSATPKEEFDSQAFEYLKTKTQMK